jgi:hypothetical protein
MSNKNWLKNDKPSIKPSFKPSESVMRRGYLSGQRKLPGNRNKSITLDDALRARGEAIPDALLAHLAPFGWQINLTDDSFWGADGRLSPDGCVNKG